MRKSSNGTERGGQKSSSAPLEKVRTRSHVPSSQRPASARTAGAASSGPKSLMKTSRLATRSATLRFDAAPTPVPTTKARQKPVPSARAGDRSQKIEERIAAASEELASGITEAASAAEELRRAMEQISSGAEEAASASQQTLAVANSTSSTLFQARERAEHSRRRTEALQSVVAES